MARKLPVDRYGFVFDPVTCKRNGGYWIGPKGAEIKVNDFEKAVKILAALKKAQWRRPNKVGNWGIVTGTKWI